jgi:Outer membrane protein beta-barrel domain
MAYKLKFIYQNQQNMQKKILACLLVAMTIGVSSFAQFHAGVKAGANLTKLDGQSFKEGFSYGYHLGGWAAINFSDKVGIQPELLFNQYSSKTTSKFSDIYQGSSFKDVTLNYLTIPLLLNVSTSKLLTLQLGGQAGVLINNHETILQNSKDAFKKGDFSALGGVQLNLGAVKLSGRYFVGLNDINDIDKKDRWRNQGFQLSIGYKII